MVFVLTLISSKAFFHGYLKTFIHKTDTLKLALKLILKNPVSLIEKNIGQPKNDITIYNERLSSADMD